MGMEEEIEGRRTSAAQMPLLDLRWSPGLTSMDEEGEEDD
jgi:hypothetical protein